MSKQRSTRRRNKPWLSELSNFRRELRRNVSLSGLGKIERRKQHTTSLSLTASVQVPDVQPRRATLTMEAEVEVVTLTEDDLFRLSDYVDALVETNHRFKDDGVLLVRKQLFRKYSSFYFLFSTSRWHLFFKVLQFNLNLVTVFCCHDWFLNVLKLLIVTFTHYELTSLFCCFQFEVADGSGKGTSLEEFFIKYRAEIEDSVKRLNPISVPQSKEFYGHMSFFHEVLDQEEVESFRAVLDQPSEYLVSPNNCW